MRAGGSVLKVYAKMRTLLSFDVGNWSSEGVETLVAVADCIDDQERALRAHDGWAWLDATMRLAEWARLFGGYQGSDVGAEMVNALRKTPTVLRTEERRRALWHWYVNLAFLAFDLRILHRVADGEDISDEMEESEHIAFKL